MQLHPLVRPAPSNVGSLATPYLLEASRHSVQINTSPLQISCVAEYVTELNHKIQDLTMHALWCCGLRRQSRDSNTGNKISFTAIFRTSNTPVVDTTRNPQGFNTEPNSDSPCEQVSPFEGPVELCQLGDSNPEHDEIKSLNPGGRTSTFEGVKARIVKHLSQDSGPRRHSRVSIGHSDEELARRAEVRRLRQMRIQDELNKDVDNDGNSNRSHQSARYLSTLIDMGSPCSGPRDTLEFTFDDCALASPVTSSDLSSTRYMPAEDDNCQQDAQIQDVCFSRGRNSPLETQSNADEMLSQSRPIRGPLPQRRCVSMVSISPRPSSCQPGSPRLDRIIGLDNEFNIRHGSHAWDDQSTLGIWLIAQGMKLSDNSVFQSEHCPREGTSTRNIIRLSTDEMCGVDSILESSFSVPDRVTTTESRLPTHDEEAIEDPAQTVPMNEEQAEVVHLQYSQSAANVNTEVELSKEVVHNGSSNYPSGLPSFVPTPSGSESHGYVLSQRDLDNLELSPVHCMLNITDWQNPH